jgi:hypothetical protein
MTRVFQIASKMWVKSLQYLNNLCKGIKFWPSRVPVEIEQVEELLLHC